MVESCSPSASIKDCRECASVTTETNASKSDDEQSKREWTVSLKESSPLSECGEAPKKEMEHEDDDWNLLGTAEPKVDREKILQDLRTFTWALDTIEKWSDCPVVNYEKFCSLLSFKTGSFRVSGLTKWCVRLGVEGEGATTGSCTPAFCRKRMPLLPSILGSKSLLLV
ncbi:hypothetical protein COOONC_02132 [Cooperia oncophora]